MTDTDADYPRDLIGYGRNPPHAQWPFCDLCCGLFSARQIASALIPDPSPASGRREHSRSQNAGGVAFSPLSRWRERDGVREVDQ